MKRFVNVRIPVLIACAVAVGVLIGYLFVYYNINSLWFLAVVPLTAFFFILFGLLNRPKFIIISISIFLVLTAGMLNSYFRLKNFSTCDIDTEETHYISGTVVDIADYGESNNGLYVIIDNASADGTKINGKIRAFIRYRGECGINYKISFIAKLSGNDAFPYGKLSYYAEKNIKYNCVPVEEPKVEYRFSFFGSIKTKIRETLYNNLDKDTASICFAMLTGETTGIDEESLQNIRYGGIAHIFAVSGLHIGIVFAAVSLLLKAIKANKFLSAFLCLGIIILYAGVCGFTLSSVRAVIMCAVSIIAKLFYLKNDNLNSLAYAVTLILLITPLSLFSIGFQLSVCAVGGIILLSHPIRSLFNKIKIPDKISSGAGATFGAQLGTLPVMLKGFGYVSGAGLILNLIIIPIITPMFLILFTGTLFSAVIPLSASVVIPAAALPIETLMSFFINTGFENAVIKGFGAGWFTPVYFILIALLSDKINLKLIPRTVTAILFILFLTIYSLIKSHTPFSGCEICVSANYYGGNIIFKTSKGNVLVIAEDISVSKITTTLNDNYATDLEGIIILGNEESLNAFDKSFNCRDIYVSNLNFPGQPWIDINVHYEKTFSLCGIDFNFFDEYSLTADCGGVKTGINTQKDNQIKYCDLLISSYEDNTCLCNATVYFNIKGHEYNIYEYGDLKFIADNYKLNLRSINRIKRA